MDAETAERMAGAAVAYVTATVGAVHQDVVLNAISTRLQDPTVTPLEFRRLADEAYARAIWHPARTSTPRHRAASALETALRINPKAAPGLWSGYEATLRAQALPGHVAIAQDGNLDLNSPEGQAKIQGIREVLCSMDENFRAIFATPPGA